MAILPCCSAFASTLRVVSYNIDDDTGAPATAARTNMTSLGVILTAIGNEHLAGNSQPIDVLGLEETHYNGSSPSSSLAAITSTLNGIYGAGTYAYDTYIDPTTGNSAGNGPSGLVYNTRTVKAFIDQTTAITNYANGSSGLISGSGASRAPMRYLLAPIGYGSNANFYLYVEHAKALSGSETRRQIEADAVRADSDALGASAHIIYSGDLNLTGEGSLTNRTLLGSNEPAYLDLTAPGNGQAIDPLHATGWDNTSAWTSIESEAGNAITARFDFQLVTNAMLNQTGMQLVPGTYTTFGNSTSTVYNKAVNASTNTLALTDLPNRIAILNLLADKANVTDHLPIVADYTTIGIAPLPIVWAGGVGTWSTANKWVSGLVPTNPDVEVQIDNSNSVASVVTLDISTTVADIVLDTNDTLNIPATSILTLKGPATTSVNGTLINNGSIVATNISTGPTSTFTTTGAFKLTGTFTNLGTAAFSGSQNWSNGSLFNNSAGTAAFNSDAGLPTATLTINALAGSVSFGSTQHLLFLNISSGATARLTATGSKALLVTNSLFVAGTLDLAGNDLDVASQNLSSGNLTTLTALVKQGFTSAATGILSSKALVDTTHLTTLGILQNNQSGTALFTASNPLDGTTPGVSDILIRYTYFGDANLDEKVDGSDYSRIDAGFLANATGSSTTGWFNGDFNYDGQINGSDYTLIDNAYNTQSTRLNSALADPLALTTAAVSSPTAVPEPAEYWLPAIAPLLLLSRRQKTQSTRRGRCVMS